MSRYLGPRLRITRRLGHLSGLTRKKPIFKPLNPVNPFGPRKIIPPGQHGRNKSFKKKPYESCEYDYLIRLKLKQRLRYHYGLTERQLVRYVQQAKKIKGSTGRVLLRLLEMRLDNIVFRLHMAPTIKAARQLISHGHILVNKKKVTIPSYQCEPKDVITVAPKIISMELVSRFLSEFDKEKSRYDRILQILEFGRKGVTMSTKNVSSTNKRIARTGGLSSRKKVFNNSKRAKVQSLKIGTLLNVTVKHRGRKEAEAISYGFGKMIVIHPFFIGKQSINKNVRVIIYKKSKNNKILYTYPANPFYLHLENLRQLNSLDVAKLFSNSLNQISSKFKSKTRKKDNSRKNKRSTSALIVMNAAKMLPKTNLERRKRVAQAQTKDNKERSATGFVSKEFSPSIFVRIVAAKCLASKSKHKSLNISSVKANLKGFNPSFSKDPVAYREKYVYTKTSRALRLFGTRFYAKVLKNKKETKNSTFIERKNNDARNIVKMGKPTGNNPELISIKEKVSKVNLPKTTTSIKAFKNLTSKILRRDIVDSVPLTNSSSVPFTFKSKSPSLGNSLLYVGNKTKWESGTAFSASTLAANSGLANVPGLFKKYKSIFSKICTLKSQKNLVSSKNLKTKILTNFISESQKLSLPLDKAQNFIFVFFEKFCNYLKNQESSFKTNTIVSITQNIKNLGLADLSVQTTEKSTMNILLFILKYRLFINNAGVEQINSNFVNSQKIQKDISLLLLLDKIKSSLKTSLQFVNNFFSSDILINSILPYFNSSNPLHSCLLRLDKLINAICFNVLHFAKTTLTLSKLNTLQHNEKTINNTEQSANLSQKLLNELSEKNNILYKKVINFAMVSLPKAVSLIEYEKVQQRISNSNQNNSLLYTGIEKEVEKALHLLGTQQVKQQKTQMVKTFNLFNRLDLLSQYSITTHKKNILLNLNNQLRLFINVKNSMINKYKVDYLNTQLSNKSLALSENNIQDFLLNVEQKLLIKQNNQKMLLLAQLNSNSRLNQLRIKDKLLCKTKIFLEMLNRKNTLFNTLRLLKDYHLIKETDYKSLTNILHSKFNVLYKLNSLLSTIDFTGDYSVLLKTVLNKNLVSITQSLAAGSSFLKVFMSASNPSSGLKKLNVTDINLVKQSILKTISFTKVQYTKNSILNFLTETNLTAFRPFDGSNKNFKFIQKTHKINLLKSTLRSLNLIDDLAFIRVFSDIREKVAFNQLRQTNVILANLLEFSALSKLSWNTKPELLSLDTFIQTIFLNNVSCASTTKILDLHLFRQKDAFWKKLFLSLTPSKIKLGLEKLNCLNISTETATQYSYLLSKLNNISKPVGLLDLSFNKNYVIEKMQLIKTILISICKNLNLVNFSSLNIVKKTVWGRNITAFLGLNRQKKLKDLTMSLTSQKLNYLDKFQLSVDKSTELNELCLIMNNYIENQYSYLFNKLLLNETNSEINEILKGIKLYLLRYQFIFTNKNGNSLTNKVSGLLGKTIYQKLKNSLRLNMSFLQTKDLLENKHIILAYLQKELKAKLLYKLLLVQNTSNNLLLNTELKEFSNTFKKFTASSLGIKLSTEFLDSISQNSNLSDKDYLTRQIFNIYKSTNITGSENFISNRSSFDLTILKNKVFMFKVLNYLKFKLNNQKINNLINSQLNLSQANIEMVAEGASVNQGSNNSLKLKAKSSMYETFAKLTLIENAFYTYHFDRMPTANYCFDLAPSVLHNAKSIYLKEFNKNLKFVLYLANLNNLRASDIISEQQYLQFKDNSETIFKLVKKHTILINVLNKRKKWKFINYGTYQTFVKNISNNLTSKISAALIKQENSKSSLQGQDLNQKVSTSLEVESLVQQTLEQLVNSTELTNNNVNTLIYRFIEKSNVITSSSVSSKQLLLQKKIVIKPLIKKTLQNIISIQKQLQSVGTWASGKSPEKGLENKQKQKTLVLQNLVFNLQKSEANFEKVGNKFKKICMFEVFSFAQRKAFLNKLALHSDSSQDFSIINSSPELLLKRLDNLQFRFQKEYLLKLTSLMPKNNLTKISPENLLGGSIIKESILLMLEKTTTLDLTNYKKFITMNEVTNYNVNNIATEIYKTKLLFQFILKNLKSNFIEEKALFEFKQISKAQKAQFNANLLFKAAALQYVSANNRIKINMSKAFAALVHSLTIMPFEPWFNEKRKSSFISYTNIEKLVEFGLISSTMANVLNQKIKAQVQNQKLANCSRALVSLKNLQTKSSTKFDKLIHSTILMDIFSQLYTLKTLSIISERKYLLIKQKLKIFSLFSALNQKLLEFSQTGLISLSNAVEFRKQMIQKISQKIKKAKTFAKFKLSLKSLENLLRYANILKSSSTNKNSKNKLVPLQTKFLFTLLNSRGRWAQVTLKQLVNQKVLTTRQEDKLKSLLANQTNIKLKKLRRLLSVFMYCRQVLETQKVGNWKNANYVPLLHNVIYSILKSFNGPWKIVLLNLLNKQEFISGNTVLQYLNNNTKESPSILTKASVNSLEINYTQTKLKKLLDIYYQQILKLRQSFYSREIVKAEFDQKLSSIFSSILLLLQKGGLDAFKVIYASNWINQLITAKNISQKTNKRSKNNQITAINDFTLKYSLLKQQYLTSYQKSLLNDKIKLFNVYKSTLLNELLDLQKTLISSPITNLKEQTSANNLGILSFTRLEQFKKQSLINTKTYKKLKLMLNNSLQRLEKLDRLFALKNLYLVTSEAKNISDNIVYNNGGLVVDSTSSKLGVNNNSMVLNSNSQYIKLKQKIFQSYLRYEYKQIEKSLIKQKLLLETLRSDNIKQKMKKQYKTNLRRKKSTVLSSEQFSNFFQQLLNFLDSRYKSVGRNRRNPRINSIIRRLNQKLAFDKTLTKKFGDHLQSFIDKRFGPALPIPPHLELKRWKIKTSKLKKRSDLILPVGIVHDLAPRRSVGLPILERLIVEYYSRN